MSNIGAMMETGAMTTSKKGKIVRNTPDQVYREIRKEALACQSKRLRLTGGLPAVCGSVPLGPYPGSE